MAPSSNEAWLPQCEADIKVLFRNGAHWHFPAVQMELITRADDYDTITLEFKTLEAYEISTANVAPETKAEKRRRLINELYPKK